MLLPLNRIEHHYIVSLLATSNGFLSFFERHHLLRRYLLSHRLLRQLAVCAAGLHWRCDRRLCFVDFRYFLMSSRR